MPSESLNIADAFLAARLREGRGDRVALRLSDRDLTYAEVARLGNRFGNTLRALGVRQEERVLLALPDGAEYVGALFGILKLGAVVVMVNPGLPGRKPRGHPRLRPGLSGCRQRGSRRAVRSRRSRGRPEATPAGCRGRRRA